MEFWVTPCAVLYFSLISCSEDEGTPACDVVPTTIDFGTPFFTGPAVPQSIPREIVISNTGTVDLEIMAHIEVLPPTGATPPARLANFHFDSSISGSRFVVSPGESQTIVLTLTGDSNVAGGEYSGTLNLGLPCGPIPFSADITIGE